MSIKDSVLSYFSEKKTFPDQEQMLACRYLEAGIIDSMGIIELIAHFEDRHNIRFEAEDLQSDEFQSIGGLVSIIERLSAHA